jgi:hypothetical protein
VQDWLKASGGGRRRRAARDPGAGGVADGKG